MSGGLTGAGATAALNYLTGRSLDAGTAPQTMQLALLTAAPPTNPAVSDLTEVQSTGYARQAVTWAAATNPTPGQPCQISNSNSILYGPFLAAGGLTYPTTYCALIGTTVPGATNLLSANASDIETDDTAWSAVLNCAIAQATLHFKTGSHSLQVTSTASGDTRVGLVSPVTIVPGNTYQATTFCYAPASGITITYDMQWLDAGANVLSTSTSSATSTAANSWAQQYTVSGVAPANAVSVSLLLRPQATAASQVFYFDELTLTSTLHPTVFMTWQFDVMGQAAQMESLQVAAGALTMTLG